MDHNCIHLEELAQDIVVLSRIVAKLAGSRMLRPWMASVLSQDELDWLAARIEAGQEEKGV